jgi:hypothetical protein
MIYDMIVRLHAIWVMCYHALCGVRKVCVYDGATKSGMHSMDSMVMAHSIKLWEVEYFQERKEV